MIYLKTPQEIQKMKKACRIVGDMLRLLEEKIHVGMTTKELDAIAYNYIVASGAKPNF